MKTLREARALVQAHALLKAEAERLAVMDAERVADELAGRVPSTRADAAALVRAYVLEDLSRVRPGCWSGWERHERRELHEALLAAGRADEARAFEHAHRAALSDAPPHDFVTPLTYRR